MKMLSTPGYIETHLAEDMGADIGGSGTDDVGAAVAELESSTADSPIGSSEEPQSENYYDFDYGEKDGQARKGSFKTEQEMKDYYRDNYFMHSDYTNKTTELANQRKEFEGKQNKFEQEQTAYLAMSNQYRDWDEKFNKLPQASRNEIEKIINGFTAVSPEMRAMQEKLEAIEKDKETATEGKKREEAQRSQEALLGQTHKYLSQKYPNYNSESVSKMVKDMRAGTQEQQITRLLELVHLSNQDKPAAPASRSPLSGGARPIGSVKPIKHLSDDEARAAAIKELS